MKKKIMAFLLAATMVVGCATTANAGVTVKAIKADGYQATNATFWNSDISNFRTANPTGYNAIFTNQTDATSKNIVEAYRKGELATTVEGTTQIYGTLGAYQRADYVTNYGSWLVANWDAKGTHANSATAANAYLYQDTNGKIYTNGSYAIYDATSTKTDDVKNLSWGSLDYTKYVAQGSKVVDLSTKQSFTSGNLGAMSAIEGTAFVNPADGFCYVVTSVKADGSGFGYKLVPDFMALTLRNDSNAQATWQFTKVDNSKNGSDIKWNNKDNNVNKYSYSLFRWKDEYSSRIFNEENILNKAAKEAVDKAWADAISPLIVKAYNEAKGELDIADDAQIGDIFYLEAKKTSGDAGKYCMITGDEMKTVTDKAKKVVALHWTGSAWEQVAATAVRDYVQNNPTYGVMLELADFSPIMIIEVTDEGGFVNEAAAAAPNKSVQTGASFLGL